MRSGGGRWVYDTSGLARLAVATHVWFVGQAVLVVVVIPHAYLQLRLSPFQLGVVFAVAGVGALVGAAVSAGLGNSHGMSYRQALTPDNLQARTNITMRSLNRSMFVIVSPLAGLMADRFGYGPALVAAAAIFGASALILAFSPFRHTRVDAAR